MSLNTNAAQLQAVLQNGTNLATDTTLFGDKRVVTVNGDFEASITVQVSGDNVNFVDALTFTAPGRQDIDVAAPYMRVRVSGFIRASEILVFVAGDPTAVKTASLALPVGGTDGIGAVSDVLPLGGSKTIIVTGPVPGCAVIVEAAAIEAGDPSTWWQQIACFYGPGYQVVEFEGTSMRVRLAGVADGLSFAGTVTVCAADEVETVDTNLSIKQSGTLNVYINALFGRDENDGLSPTTALATLRALFEKYPLELVGPAQVIVNLAAGGALADEQAAYVCDTIRLSGGTASNNRYHFRGPAMVLAPISTGTFSQFNGFTFTAEGHRTRVDVTLNPGWQPGELCGLFARFRQGQSQLKSAFEQVITENGDTYFYVDTEEIIPELNPLSTSIDICQPGAAISNENADGSVWILGNGSANPAAELYWGVENLGAAFERIQFDAFVYSSNVPGLTFDRCTINFFPSWIGGTVGHFNTSYPGGVKLSCGSLEYPITGRPDALGDPSGTGYGTEFQAFELVLVGNPDAIATYKAWRNVSVYFQSLATRGAIHVYGMGSIFYASELALFFNPCALQGADNAGPFIWCVQGGQAHINTTAGADPLTTGTGTGNPLRVGIGAANPAIAYGTGAGAYQAAAGFNGNFHRMLAGTAAAPTGDASRIFTPV
jgi:hypothetical protein